MKPGVLARLDLLEQEVLRLKKRTTVGGGGVPTSSGITELPGFPGDPDLVLLGDGSFGAPPGSEVTIVSGFGITVDGAGEPVTTGLKGYVQLPFDLEVEAWSLVSKEAGDIQFDIWAVAAAKPVDADSITGGNEPALSASDLAEAGSVSGWTTTLAAGDWIGFNIDSTDGVITWVTLQVTGTRL